MRTSKAGLLFTLMAALLLTWLQAPAAGLYGYDGPFHIRYAAQLRADLARDGSFPRTFPAWQETFLRDHWADKDLLYHLLLIPFTGARDLQASGKGASILFGTLLFAAILAALAALRIRPAIPWGIAALVGSTTLLYRAGLLRSHVLAIALAVLGAAAILRERRIGTALLSFLYALTHIAWHLLPGIALIYDVARSVARGRWRWQGTLASLGGTLAAVLLSPYFPDNLRLWWVQNAGVLARSWSPAGSTMGLGLEILPGRPADLFYYNLGPAALTLLGVVCLGLAARRRLLEPVAMTLGTVTLGFLAMALMSRRFVEFWAPFSVLFAAVAVQGRRVRDEIEMPRGRLPLTAAVVLSLAAAGAHNVTQTRRIIGEDPGPIFAGCARWLHEEAPAGSQVVTTDWDEFPELYFEAPRLHYLVGLDPTFMQATDPRRFARWRQLAEGRSADLPGEIAGTFHGRYLFADAGYARLAERLRQDPLMRPEYGEPDCAVWSVRGEPGARGRPFESRWWIDAASSPAAVREGGFVDLAAIAPMGTECATVQGELRPAGGEPLPAPPVALTISSDDQVELVASGRTIYDSRVADAPDLDDILARHRAGGRFALERRVLLDQPGPWSFTLKSCRAGEAWGFHMRLPDESEPR